MHYLCLPLVIAVVSLASNWYLSFCYSIHPRVRPLSLCCQNTEQSTLHSSVRRAVASYSLHQIRLVSIVDLYDFVFLCCDSCEDNAQNKDKGVLPSVEGQWQNFECMSAGLGCYRRATRSRLCYGNVASTQPPKVFDGPNLHWARSVVRACVVHTPLRQDSCQAWF